jgi:hypothetical protein
MEWIHGMHGLAPAKSIRQHEITGANTGLAKWRTSFNFPDGQRSAPLRQVGKR